MSRLFTIMGSGETTPTMTATHRGLKSAAGSGAAAVMDTPYGFQENADDITERTLDYFQRSVNFTPQVASLRNAGADAIDLTKGLGLVRSAAWLFTGPGSPTYALRQWRELGVHTLLQQRLERDGVLIMSSAAALTVGVHTVPVYEIYKVGAVPEWFEGMDLLSDYGLSVALIPHFDNAEGGNHDTRFCYLGETRLQKLETQFTSEQWVLGVDEHTALIFDLEADSYSVQGKGGVTVRRAGQQAVFASGHHGPIDELRAVPGTVTATRVAVASDPDAPAAPAAVDTPASSVLVATTPLADAAQEALGRHDVTEVVRGLLSIEALLEEWKGDTSTTDERDRTRQRFNELIVSLGELAVVGTRDPREMVGPVVEVALSARVDARARKDFAQSDAIRDGLIAAGIDVRDTPTGAVWSLKGES
jgi:hypothetical protein